MLPLLVNCSAAYPRAPSSSFSPPPPPLPFLLLRTRLTSTPSTHTLGSCCRLCQVGFGTALLYGAIVTLSTVSLTWAVSFFYSTLARLGPVGVAVRAALAPLFGRSCVAVHVGQDEWCLVPAYGSAFVAIIVLWMVGHALPLRVVAALPCTTSFSSARASPVPMGLSAGGCCHNSLLWWR